MPGYSPVSADDVSGAVGRLAPALAGAGADAFNVHAARARMDEAAGEMSEAIAPVEMALLDLKARA
jgi:L-alanine-DL-glutamate epimerase-like enolase superfamily enzyme